MPTLSPRQKEFVDRAYEAAHEAGLTGVQADLSVAQAAHETAYGAKPSGTNNYHGIKGIGTNVKTHEIENGKRKNISASFKNFSSMADSFKAWGGLMGRKFSGVMSAPTLKDAVQGLRAGQQGGYATDPKYNSKVQSIAGRITGYSMANAPSLPSIDRVATPMQNPRSMLASAPISPVERGMLGPVQKSTFSPGGINVASSIDFSRMSPVSSAQAAPSPGSMYSKPSQPSASRYGPSTQNASYSALGPALASQAATLSQPTQERFGPVASKNVSYASLMSAPALSQAIASAPKTYSPPSASYQTPAFSTAAPKIDAFAQPPHPGLMPAKPSYTAPQVTQAPQQRPTQPRAPTIAPPSRPTIQSPQTYSAPQTAIGAPVDPSLTSFPAAPKTSLMGSIFGKPTVPGTIGSVVGSMLGTAALGPMGGIVGGLLGKAVGNQGLGSMGGLLGGYNGPVHDIGSGVAAVNSAMNGATPGSRAKASNGQTVTSLPGGGYQRTSSKYGWTEITTADGHTTRAKTTNGNGGYGGVESKGVRDAIDKGIGGLF